MGGKERNLKDAERHMEEIVCEHEPKLAKGLCAKCYQHQWYRRNQEKCKARAKKYTEDNREVVLAKKRDYGRKNKEEQKVRSKEYYQKNKNSIIARVTKWAHENKEKVTKYKTKHKESNRPARRAYNKEYKKSNPQRRIAENIRSRTNQAIRNKSASTQELTGCTWEFLVAHIESLFKPGMTWENRSEWHIDHKRPLSSFDLTDPEQQKLACHYTNLQPLWAEENLSKGSKII